MSTVIKVENLSKQYRLGVIGTGTLSHDLNRWWHRVRGKEDPYLKIGESNVRDKKGESDLVWALRDINFEVEQGEVLGIIGKNGAGKSTLLKILSKVTGPTTGRIMAKGRIASLLEVGTGFHPELTGRENIYLNGTILGMSKAEVRKKLDEIVDFAGVERYLDTPVKRYSSGMKVRLGFAVAAHLEPDILIVDEVLAVGDAEFQKKAIGKMQEVSHEGGRTILFVSHNMNAVRKLCSYAIILNDGKITKSGGVDEIVADYLSVDEVKNESLLEIKKGRWGIGDVKFTYMYMLNSKGNKVEQVISGEYVEIHIGYEKKVEKECGNIILSLSLMNEYGEPMASFISDEMGTQFKALQKEGEFILTIPNLWLRSARYYLRLRLNKGKTAYTHVLDQIDNAKVIYVVEGDIWRTGKNNRSGAMAIMPGTFTN